jgi:spermidine/putrescine transport system substrate-binding protein
LRVHRSLLESGVLTRRELLGLGALALGAAACGGSTGSGGGTSATTAAPSLAGKKIEDTLRYYNWGQYVNPVDVKAYEKKFGVSFRETNYTSNEELLTKLTTTRGQKVYDIIVPDGDHVRIEKDLGLLMKLDHSLIPNLKNLDPYWRNLPYDPGNEYSVMKDTGLTVFTLRTDRVNADLRSWKDFFDFLPHAGDLNVNFFESPGEMVGIALQALGFSMNSESDSELNQARDLLLKVRPYVDTINYNYIDDFISGKIDLGTTYSGDGIRIRTGRSKQGDIKVVPPERSEIWTDNWAISAYAPDPVAAHAWINFMLDPNVNAKEMEYVQYAVGTPASYPLVGAAAKDPLVVFPKSLIKDYEFLRTTPDGLNKRTAIWAEFKGG